MLTRCAQVCDLVSLEAMAAESPQAADFDLDREIGSIGFGNLSFIDSRPAGVQWDCSVCDSEPASGECATEHVSSALVPPAVVARHAHAAFASAAAAFASAPTAVRSATHVPVVAAPAHG